MFDTLFWFTSTAERHRAGPFAAERERYLLHGQAVGATALTQQQRARVLLRVAQEMSPDDRQGVEVAGGQPREVCLRHRLARFTEPAADPHVARRTACIEHGAAKSLGRRVT